MLNRRGNDAWKEKEDAKEQQKILDSFDVKENLKNVMMNKALKNYEDSFQLPEGCATIDMVNADRGIEYWSKIMDCDEFENE